MRVVLTTQWPVLVASFCIESTVEKECLAIKFGIQPRKALYSTNGPSDTTVAGSGEGEQCLTHMVEFIPPTISI